MASGKKGKKTKGKTLALNDFLQETTGSVPNQPIRKSTTSWADEVEDFDESKIVNVVLPTAPKASRDYDDIEDKVPKEGPFMAYLSNLSYDVEEADIEDFFRNLKIASMRLPRDDRGGEVSRLKGFGYVEFEDRESLMSALIIPDTNLKNRRIRIEVATNAENDRRRGRMGDRMGGADTGGDWRSATRPEPSEDRRGGGGFNRDRDGGGFGRDRDREGGSSGAFTREGMREPGSRDHGGFSRDREFNREGGGGGGFSRHREQDDRPWRDGDRSSSFNDRGFSRGNYRDSDRNNGSRYEQHDRDGERRGGGFRRHDDGNERNEGFTRGGGGRTFNGQEQDNKESEGGAPSSGSRQRQKLNLAPRTKPLDPTAVKPEPAVSAASIFGNAKPVDTAERERQIEERLLKEQEERLTDNKEKEGGQEEESAVNKKHFERSRPFARGNDREKEPHRDADRGPSSRDRRPLSKESNNDSGDDNRKAGHYRSEHKSPDSKKRIDKQEKPKREEKKDRPEKDLPKVQEPETPNFQQSNKYALLGDSSD